ncbi:5-oxoprolinase subunit PxpB [Rosenbergiella epipactidis]|uniref:5-oxoprolinase subunit PxpB n=1 Tax=Rosenbergiella epipactidis TaxID=1544694 RepID=UPI001BDB2A3B|nr:5-oxoprolinase subunit PxpB [Rosenbergiella epipactidis]MBT0718671.1 5-oxoprolinase subunit PxpB [Rosenbergiella epipactidis]
MSEMRYYMFGESTLVIESRPPVSLAVQQRIWGLAQQLVHEPGVAEVIPGMNNLTIRLQAIPPSQQDAVSQLKAWWQAAESFIPASRNIDIPVIYGKAAGPDLSSLAETVGLTPKQVVEAHSAERYTVFFIGFQPGFPYFSGLSPRLACPRHKTPRLSVPAGSVGIAGSQTGIYPLTSPGGWQIIGQTSSLLFDETREAPFLLRPGDTVRFIPHKDGLC